MRTAAVRCAWPPAPADDTLPCDDAVEPDPVMQAMVVDPVEAYLEDLDNLVLGTSEVDLDGLRSACVRWRPTRAT